MNIEYEYPKSGWLIDFCTEANQFISLRTDTLRVMQFLGSFMGKTLEITAMIMMIMNTSATSRVLWFWYFHVIGIMIREHLVVIFGCLKQEPGI